MRSRSLTSYLMLSLALVSWLGCKPAATEDDATGTNSEPSASSPLADVNSLNPAAEPASAVNGASAQTSAAPRQPGAPLTIGDPAPELAIAQWIKGQPIEGFQAGQVYVIEFWATWCGPCRVTMPHLSQLQDTYREQVAFVGVSDETKDEVQDFLQQVQDQESGKTWSEVVTYAIALDDSLKNTGKSFMAAAKQNAIPTAFIVGKDGHLDWIGHPMDMDEPLARIVSGDWDRVAALAQFHEQQKKQELLVRLQQAIVTGQATGNWSELSAIVTEAEQLDLPTRELNGLKFDVGLLSKNYAEAQAAADELATIHWEDAQRLGALAWSLVERVPRQHQNHEQALRLARRACELTENNNALMLDTLARIYFEAGDLQQAVEWQRQAVAIEPELKPALAQYEALLAGGQTGPTEPAQLDASPAPEVEDVDAALP